MTRKKLQEIRESYKDLAASCLNSSYSKAEIVGVCKSIATETRYNHHERGQRLWAFFQALEDVEYGNA